MRTSSFHKICIAFFFILLIIFSYLATRSTACYEGSDNFSHYKIARYSWNYPFLFLDHWGKPVFTLLCSPFAQFGFKVAKLFNVLAGSLTALFTVLVAKQLRYKNPLAGFIFVSFSPIYFLMINTVMTEILFSLFLILGIFLFLRKQYNSTALLISLLPFVRSEGYLFIFFFACIFLINKNRLASILLCSGFVFYTLIGLIFYYHDIGWVFNQNPYQHYIIQFNEPMKLLHFIRYYKYITGSVVGLLTITGVLFFRRSTRLSNKSEHLNTNYELILVYIPFFVFFLVHSILYWTGMFGSIGEFRVIACVIPLAALISIQGMNFLLISIPFRKFVFFPLLFTGLIIIFYENKNIFHWGFKHDESQQLAMETADWIKANHLDSIKFYFYDPIYFVLLNKDPFNPLDCRQKVYFSEHPEIGIKNGELIIWDAHFAPNNEQVLNLKTLLESNYFELIKMFQPGVPFKVNGDIDYEIYIFKRVNKNKNPAHSVVSRLDFETPRNQADILFRSDTISFNGNYSYKLDSIQMYLPLDVIPVGSLLKSGVENLKASVYFFPVVDPTTNHSALVASFERKDSSYENHIIGLQETAFRLNSWNKISLNLNIPSQAQEGDILKIVVYQPGYHYIYVDQLQLEAIRISYKQP